jgi:uncharacterized protein (DUF58 family)
MKIPKWIKRQIKKKPRIYIIPTRMGGYLNGLIFLMFLLSVGYNNNLLLIFTLFLFGLNLIWLIQSHFHMHKLKLDSVSIEDGHAMESVHVRVQWKNSPPPPLLWELALENDQEVSLRLKGIEEHKVQDGHHNQTEGQLIYPKRGVWKFKHIRVKTTKPFGLYETWRYLKLDILSYAYPPKLKEVPQMPTEPSYLEGDHQSPLRGPHDVWNLAPYQGEESRKISWKHYARVGELVVKEGEDLKKSVVHFTLPKKFKDKEHTLSTLATQMVLCSRTETPFSYEDHMGKTEAGSSQRHLRDCLRRLSLC